MNALTLAVVSTLLAMNLFAAGKTPLDGPYDEMADGGQLVEKALARARAEQKRVLLVFGANWCSDCRAMASLFTKNQQIGAVLSQSYVVEKIDVGRGETPRRNAALIERFGVAVETGIPVLVVANADGKALNDTRKERLADSDHREPDKVLAFLRRWAASSVD